MNNTVIKYFENFSWVDAIDIALLLLIIYQVYKWVKGTSALNITLSIIALFIFWKISDHAHLRLTSQLLDKVVSVGFIALIIIFQPEIRRFLFMLGNRPQNTTWIRKFFSRLSASSGNKNILPIILACTHMSASKTGALIILIRKNKLPQAVSTGEQIDGIVSSALIENIFFKNSPLHDGAAIIDEGRVVAARCILPVTSNQHVSDDLGLRHRAAIGITEQTDALAIVVSEETGSISYCMLGSLVYNVSPAGLQKKLEEVM
ncbi:MAG: diadenylate cyclase CdaA [Bacteroidales bacterium]|jgi:uncharacterized protein (TIGR00159 family)|nr:diadenylate cyclase CdaA [Bacteroidales bacterium]